MLNYKPIRKQSSLVVSAYPEPHGSGNTEASFRENSLLKSKSHACVQEVKVDG